MYLGKDLVYLDHQIIIFLEISIHSVSTDISNVEFCVDMLEKILMVIIYFIFFFIYLLNFAFWINYHKTWRRK